MLKEIKNLFAFLTVLPIKMDMDCLVDSAKLIWLFPVVGAFIGLLAGVFGWVISLVVPGIVAGTLTLGLLLLLTGLHHADGLLDFGDAVMFHGTSERKIEIMHDQLTGAGAIGLGVMTYIVTAASFGELSTTVFFGGVSIPLIIPALVVIEAAAKLSMVVGAWAGRPVHEGMSSTFLKTMHGDGGNIRLMGALALSFTFSGPLFLALGLGFSGFITILAAILAGLMMVSIAHRHFKGVTGDVLGATNEIVRMVCAVVLLAMI